jgi:hypothetical protein
MSYSLLSDRKFKYFETVLTYPIGCLVFCDGDYGPCHVSGNFLPYKEKSPFLSSQAAPSFFFAKGIISLLQKTTCLSGKLQMYVGGLRLSNELPNQPPLQLEGGRLTTKKQTNKQTIYTSSRIPCVTGHPVHDSRYR